MEDIIKIKNVSQVFPGVKALDEINFNIKKGTIHAICGENGAGKSTFIKILAGVNTKYTGEVYLESKKINFKSPFDSLKSGISVVHQEINLSETLSVAENIFLGNLIYKKGLVDWNGIYKKAQQLIDELEIDIDVHEVVDTLTVAKKQIVEICKAISHNCKIIIMDEPSATLTDKELKILFNIIRRMVEKGITVVYISHRLEEVFNLADYVTVLRDGKHIDTIASKELTKDTLISMMVGRKLENEYPKEKVNVGEVILEVKDIKRKNVLENISFDLRRGEILGISGLVGSGRTELMRAILGIDKIDSGKIILKNQEIKNKNFKEAINRGFGLIPEDRKVQGLIQIFSIKDNIGMVSINKFISKGLIDYQKEKQYAMEYVKKLGVIAPSIDTEVQYLSGGNQQKVVIAKWLMEDCDIIILDEPTRGIDIGAKAEIYKLMCNLVKQGKSIIMISSELPEVLGMSDRILVMHEGRRMGILSCEDATQEEIMSMCI